MLLSVCNETVDKKGQKRKRQEEYNFNVDDIFIEVPAFEVALLNSQEAELMNMPISSVWIDSIGLIESPLLLYKTGNMLVFECRHCKLHFTRNEWGKIKTFEQSFKDLCLLTCPYCKMTGLGNTYNIYHTRYLEAYFNFSKPVERFYESFEIVSLMGKEKGVNGHDTRKKQKREHINLNMPFIHYFVKYISSFDKLLYGFYFNRNEICTKLAHCCLIFQQNNDIGNKIGMYILALYAIKEEEDCNRLKN